MALTVKVKINMEYLVEALANTGKKYVTVKDLSTAIGVSTKTAGRLMSRLEEEGYVKRYSNKAYKLLTPINSHKQKLTP